MNGNLDDIFMADYDESLGLPGRFAIPDPIQPDEDPDPLNVSMTGVELPEDKSIGGYLKGVGMTWGEMLRGSLAATAGAGGDVEQIIYGIQNIIDREAGEGAGEAFMRGFTEETMLPTTEEMKEIIPEVAPDQEAATQIGEMLGIGGAAKVIQKGSKALATGAALAPTAAQGKESMDFYSSLAENMESWHGGIPAPTKDASEANKPDDQKTKDVGYGHKVKASEEKSGLIHGIPFKDEQGNYIELSKEDAIAILKGDMEENVAYARKGGWDKKLAKAGSSWEALDEPYRQVLSSLAYNIGGPAAGKWTEVIKAAAKGDVKAFAKELRRKDAGKNTAGMDNRVVKELYYSGLISSLSEVKSVLPLADANQAGIPA